MNNSPINPFIRERTISNSAAGYHAKDASDSDFFIEASILYIKGETILTFVVRATKPGLAGSSLRGKVKGIEFFDAMWIHFAAMGTTIDVIQGEWSAAPLASIGVLTTNLDAFNKAIQTYPSYEEAALHGTVTGKYAKRKGYTNVAIVRLAASTIQGRTTAYEEVIVQFRKP